ncbi:MAG: hypothetical protein H0U52_08035 [Chloroflexi bacterium]|nr:hypothetical protein [Chloroflexota bacterium]
MTVNRRQSAQRSDSTGRSGSIAIWLAVVGLLAWSASLVVALAGGGYGWPTAAARPSACSASPASGS